MHILCNQRKKLHKADTLFFEYGKKKLYTKSHLLALSFSHFTILKFQQRRLLREFIETYLPKTLLYRKSLFVLAPNIIEV